MSTIELELAALIAATDRAAEQTAALVKEQRTANLIAFTDTVMAGVRAGEKPSELVWTRFESAGMQIIEGLTL